MKRLFLALILFFNLSEAAADTFKESLVILSQIPGMEVLLEAAMTKAKVTTIDQLVPYFEVCELSDGRDGEFRYSQNRICLREGISPQVTLLMMAHELTHFAYYRHNKAKPQNYEEFADGRLAAAGGEYAAYQNQVRVARYLRAQGQLSKRYLIEAYFDEHSLISNKEGLKNFILTDLKYGIPFKRDFDKRMEWFEKNGVLTGQP